MQSGEINSLYEGGVLEACNLLSTALGLVSGNNFNLLGNKSLKGRVVP